MARSIKITINLDNDAFQGDPREEVARILEELGAKIGWIRSDSFALAIRDVNGNVCGCVEDIKA